ncbi:VanZ family protein [Candidatus Parcubacteria bacterium]|nr:VanZ family protein [Candidatus Parcubacteria bacterium]
MIRALLYRGGRLLRRYAFYAALPLSWLVLFTPPGSGPLPFAQADKLIHAGLFALLAATAGWRWRRRRIIAAGLLLYALTSEVIQGGWIAGRQFDLIDLLADSIGLAAALAAGGARSSLKRNRESKNHL